jgi:exopolysaccharide production protein ExoZ
MIRSVEALRGIAALLVVLFHATVLQHEKFDPGLTPWEFGNAGVDIFFVISGFLMIRSSGKLLGLADGWRRFATQRLIRIVPLYWLVTVAKLASIAAVPALALHTHPNLLNAAASFLFLPSYDAAGAIRPVVDVGWTLEFEMLFYVLFTAALWLRADAFRFITPILGLLAAAWFVVPAGSPAISFLANPLCLEFALGMLVATIAPRLRLSSPAAPLALVAVSFVVLLAVPIGSPPVRAMFWGIPAFGLVLGAVLADPWQRFPGWFVRIGNASYSLYLVHGFTLPLVGVAVAHTPLHGTAQAVAVIMGCVASSIVAALIVHAWIERPMTEWLRRIVVSPPSLPPRVHGAGVAAGTVRAPVRQAAGRA